MNIILIGAQGSGKGTQAAMLAKTFGIQHISSGDLFRKAAEDKTELGLLAKSYWDRGDLVPDDLTVKMVLHRISESDCLNGVLLDGFPRTITQARALDKGLKLAQRQIDCSIYIQVEHEELYKRLAGRYICREGQHVYNINTHPPRVPGTCDIDGSELYQRSDDHGPVVEKRLDIFFQESIHLLDYYRTQGKLIEVDGNGSIEQVHNNLLQALKAQFGDRIKVS